MHSGMKCQSFYKLYLSWLISDKKPGVLPNKMPGSLLAELLCKEKLYGYKVIKV